MKQKAWIAAVLLAASAWSAQAGTAQEEAKQGAVADGVSTALGLAAGAVELNPLGPVLGLGMKYAMMEYAKGLPDTEQPAAYAAAASVWQGAAANNICVAASILSGGAFAPACVALGVVWGLKTWQDSAQEREFWEACAILRRDVNDPALPCVYTPPGQQLAQATTTEVITVHVIDEPVSSSEDVSRAP